MKKRILIPYASYGNGHKSIALQIKKYFEANGDYECLTIDLFDYSLPVLGKVAKKTGNKLMTKLPELWSLIYFSSNNKLSSYATKNNSLKIFNNKKLKKDILDFNPDIAISTHFLGNNLISKYNKKKITNCKLITVITDYKTHDSCISNRNNVDAIIVSNLEERIRLIKKGIKNNKIFATGIPILPEMKKNLDKGKLKKKYKIDNGKKTILFFVGGGNGATHNLIYFKELLKNKYDCNIIFVAGKSKTAYKKAKNYVNTYNSSNILVYGYVTKVNELYEISDIVITKPGGAQITECLLFELPMLLIKGNGGQEIENKNFLVKRGFAKVARNKNSFNKNIKLLLENDKLRKTMKKNIKKIKQKKSMEKLFKLVEKMK